MWLFYTQRFDCMWYFFPLFFFFNKTAFRQVMEFPVCLLFQTRSVFGWILPVLNKYMRRSLSPLLQLSHLQLLSSLDREHRPKQKICRWGDSGNVDWPRYTAVNLTFLFCHSLTALIKRKLGWVSRGTNKAELWRICTRTHLETAEMLEDHGNYKGIRGI